MNTKQLPSLADLHKSPQDAFKNDQFNLLLNQPPHASWVKKFPKEMGIPGGGEYLPIDKVDFLLTYIFQDWHPEVMSVQMLLNSVAVHVRLHYKNPLTGEWSFKDGVGACPVQVDQGASPVDLNKIKSRGVQIALPIAKSTAIKDAAEELGALFGRDLNRKDIIAFAGAYSAEPAPESTLPTFNTTDL